MAVTNLNETPNALRLHIAIFGKRNSGKSSLINAITNQATALVSNVPGTTTDPVYKAMELLPIGPCVLIDTAGFDDIGELGELRVKRTQEIVYKTDIALMVFTAGDNNLSYESNWIKILTDKKIPVIAVINKSDVSKEIPFEAKHLLHVLVSAINGDGISELKALIIENAPEEFQLSTITGHLVGENDHVLLVAPQDIQAPKGRLILPQVQIIRDLLDNKAIITVITTDKLEYTLSLFKAPPKLIITDSQVFKYVYDHCPKETALTSFSVLMARYKGDVNEYVKGAKRLDNLTINDKVAILEACTHNPLDGDIGRIKIPAILRKKVGEDLQIDIYNGSNLPKNIKDYSLAIHCGGCMFNRRHVLSRIALFKENNVPITNYGILIAKVSGILDKVTI